MDQHRLRLGEDVLERVPHGLPGDAIERSVTYLGTLDNFLAGEPHDLDRGQRGLRPMRPTAHWCEAFGGPDSQCDPDDKQAEDFQPRFEEFREAPVVFLIGQYYGGLCNGVEDCSGDARAGGPRCGDVAGRRGGSRRLRDRGRRTVRAHRPRWSSAPGRRRRGSREVRGAPGTRSRTCRRTCWSIALLALLLIVPGWLAANWLGIRTTVDRIALIPGMSVVMVLLAGIAVLAVWRGPLSVAKGWTVVAVAIGLGAALRVADAWLRRPLDAFAGFFNAMFSTFSNRDFSVLDGRAVPRAGGSGGRAGRDREVARVRRPGGLRRAEPAVGRLPAHRGAGALRAVHAHLAVHRRVHRPLPSASRGVVGRRRDRDRRRPRWRSRCSCRSAPTRPRARRSRPPR